MWHLAAWQQRTDAGRPHWPTFYGTANPAPWHPSRVMTCKRKVDIILLFFKGMLSVTIFTTQHKTDHCCINERQIAFRNTYYPGHSNGQNVSRSF